jgi:MFS superfamily sulfate permease-like transporter
MYAFGSSLYYANADRLNQEALALADGADPPLRWLCLAISAAGDVDYSASETIRDLHGELADRGVTLAICGVSDEVRAELERDGLIELLGEDHIFTWVDEAVAAFRSRSVTLSG